MDLRPVPGSPANVPSDPILLEAIREEIQRDGPISFARFMEIALYDPMRGYYRSAEARPGRAGDYLTAPEAHAIFGRAVARFASGVHAAVGAPDPFTIREFGAGEGALAAPLIDELIRGSAAAASRSAPKTVRYVVDEIEPRRVEAVRARVAGLRLPAESAEVVADDGSPIDGLAIANEVLDALPTHRVVGRPGLVREICVGLDDARNLVDVETDATTPALADRLTAEGVTLDDGQQAEVCLAVDAWIRRTAAGLRAGALLLIDYGDRADKLYDRRRRAAGTLVAYRGHRVVDDPYAAIGRQDLTAHVDLTAVERAAAAAGLDRLAETTQTEFLARLGIGDLLVVEQTRAGVSLQGYLEARSALVRMIDPAAMGRFHVLVFGRRIHASADIPGLRADGDRTD